MMTASPVPLLRGPALAHLPNSAKLEFIRVKQTRRAHRASHCDADVRCRSYVLSQMETPLDAIRLRRLRLLSVYYCLFTRRYNALLIMNYAPNFVAGNVGVRGMFVCGIASHVDQRARWPKSKQMSELPTEWIRFAAARCFSVFMARLIPLTGEASRTEADLWLTETLRRGLK